MKQWIPAILLPLALLQAPALAQPKPSPEVKKPPVTTVVVPPASLLPVKGTDQINLQFVNCSWGPDCILAKLILPASTQIDHRDLQFENAAQVPVSLLSKAIVGEGKFTGFQLNQAAISLPSALKSLPADQIVTIPISFQRSLIPPDQYVGSVYLTLKDRSDRLTLPLNLSTRSGPLFPLIVLLLGVTLGRLFKYMEERGEPQAKALEEVYRLQADIASAQLEDRDKQVLVAMTQETQTAVVREKLEVVSAQVQAIRDRLATLVQLQTLENQLHSQAATFPVDVDTFTVDIRKARQLITQREDKKAKELLEKINTDLDKVGARGSGAVADIAGFKRSLSTAALATVRMGTGTLLPPEKINNFKLWLITLSGVSDRVRTEATFWVLRPILSLVLLVGLGFVGIGTLYVENPTFGAKPFSDYLGLILWGMSADVASRSLSSLKGGK